MFCDKLQKRKQTELFDKRYGQRFNRLIHFVRLREGLGWSPGDIMVTPCYRPSKEQARKMLDDFENELSAYETRFGLTAKIR